MHLLTVITFVLLLQVKTLTEECSNKKVSVDSLKQRLSVAVKEKSQYEQMYQKSKEELEKKVCVRTSRFECSDAVLIFNAVTLHQYELLNNST